MLNRHRWMHVSVILIIVTTVVAACGVERATPQVFRPTQLVTETAAVHQTMTHAPPTAGPSPTSTITPTPYMTATPFPGADPDMVVAKVGDREITLAEYQARVRYERWLPLNAIKRRVEQRGPERVLDLSLPENAQTLALLHTLGNTESMGEQTMNVLLTEAIVLHEVGLSGELELDQTYYDARIALLIGMELEDKTEKPEEWEAAYQRFIADMQLYTGMTEEQFKQSLRALTYYSLLREEISSQYNVSVDEDNIIAINVQDILLPTEEEALDVRQRFMEGESINSIAASYDMTAADGATQRQIRRGDTDLPLEIVDAIFDAEENSVVGPIETSNGWYVARVMDSELITLEPDEISALRNEFFRQWIVERLDDPDYTVVYDNWQEYVPTDPLPQDLSPLMRDEFFNSPSMVEQMFGEMNLPTPTSRPLGTSP